jgi:hypothetical protein
MTGNMGGTEAKGGHDSLDALIKRADEPRTPAAIVTRSAESDPLAENRFPFPAG